MQPNRPYLYGGPQKPSCSFQVPTFETLCKNRILSEKRIYCNNSNSKYLSIGIVPASKILNENACGFYVEAYIGGEKTSPLPLGSIAGLASLFSTIKQIPQFNRVSGGVASNIEADTNIIISTVDFAEDVSSYIHIFFR